MEFALKQIYYSLFIVSLGIQACSTGSTPAMAAEHSRNLSRKGQDNSRFKYIRVVWLLPCVSRERSASTRTPRSEWPVSSTTG